MELNESNFLKNNIKLIFDFEVNFELKTYVEEFVEWLSLKFDFPVFIDIYVFSPKYILNSKNEKVSALFFAPFKSNLKPFVKVATGDFDFLIKEIGLTNAIGSILCSLAHEVIHYNQWIQNIDFDEDAANSKANLLVQEYIDQKRYPLYISHEFSKLMDLAYDKLKDEDYEESIALYDKVLLKYDFEVAYAQKAYALDCLNRFEESIPLYDKAIKAFSSNYTYYLNKGYALAQLKRYSEAINCFRKAIMLNPQDENAHIFKATYLIELKKYKSALFSINKAIDLNSNFAESFYLRGIINFKLNNIESANSDFETCIQLNSEYIKYLKEDGYF